MLEAVLRGDAAALRACLTAAEKEDLDATIARIEADPWPDGRTKFVLPAPPLILWSYRDGVRRIAYRVVDGAFVEIYRIQHLL